MIQQKVLVFVLLWVACAAQDYSVYGLFASSAEYPITLRMKSKIYGTCFAGVGLTSCAPNLPNDDIVLSYDREYYRNLGSLQGQFYCTECCGNPPNYIDTWDLSCANTVLTQSIVGGLYNQELRMARRKTLTDTELVICPLRRSACNYVTGFNPPCDRSKDKTYLHGYTVTLTVKQYDSNLQGWRGVSACDIVSDERDYPMAAGAEFREIIVMKHVPIDTFSPNDPFKMTVICVGCFAGLYTALYFLRRKRCEYCQQKLVFSPRMCYKCVLVGAQPPDPVLLKALEERGEHMQGQLPERFGFVQRWCTGCCRNLYVCFTCQCWCSCCFKCCRFLWCCGCCGLCCRDEEKIHAADYEDLVALEANGDELKEDEDTVEPFSSKSNSNKYKSSKSAQSAKGTSIKNKSRDERLKLKLAFEAAEAKEMEMIQKRKEKNPNVLQYPSRTILKALNHPSVAR